jgi:hypothetical protein
VKRRYLIRELPVEGPPARAERAVAPDTTRFERIAEAAYYIAERRGFAPGDPVRDWLEAERAIDADTSISEDGR